MYVRGIKGSGQGGGKNHRFCRHEPGGDNVTENKNYALFLKQKETLDIFLKNGAISKAQYDKSLGDLRIKMNIKIDDKEEKEHGSRN